MKRLLICIFSVLFVTLLLSQNFTEVIGYGFGNGLDYPIPTFTDLDGDSKLDMLIGDKVGRIRHYEDSEGGCFEFYLVDFNFINIDNEDYAAPVLFDIDNDGLYDLIIGLDSGLIAHYEQTELNSYDFDLITENFVGNCGQRAQPALIDIDNDGLLDLIVGEREGNINHFEQNNINSYSFNLITDNFCDILIGEWIQLEPGVWEWCGGYPSPYLDDIDNDGLLEMLIGNFFLGLDLYKQIEVNSESFELIDGYFLGLNINSPRLYDIDDDGLMDFLATDRSEITHYEQINTDTLDFISLGKHMYGIDSGRFSSPCSNDIDNDGRIDILIGNFEGGLEHLIQDSPNSLQFSLETEYFNNIEHGYNTRPFLYDIDNDNLLDLLIQHTVINTGYIAHYEQEEMNSFTFIPISGTFTNLIGHRNECLSLYDIDLDGLVDLLLGSYDGIIKHYEQLTANSYDFEIVSENFNDIDVYSKSAPLLCDIENDGFIDLLIGNFWGRLVHYKQIEIGSYSFEFQTDNFEEISVGGHAIPNQTDIDNDGNMDIIIGNIYGSLFCYIESVTGIWDNEIIAKYEIFINNYPNPFNPTTTISFSISEENCVELTVYNIKGQKVKQLVSDQLSAGQHSVVWDGRDDNYQPVGSGIYFYKLKAGDFREVRKMILIK